ncbi:MAG: right-handed parallel beta-helix repeat-containing protein [Victivallales bacterium]|nr:right-handed parallel beta-helix repeat-containing protein [Victivallales bacterium]
MAHFQHCQGLTVRGLTVDYERPFYSVGQTIAASLTNKTFDVKAWDAFPVEGGEPVGAYMEYDPETHHPLPGGLDVYHGVEKTELIAPQTLRVHLIWSEMPKLGALMVLRHYVYEYGCFSAYGCDGAVFENLTLHHAGGIGIHASHASGTTVRNVKVVPRPDSPHFVSATADATHFGQHSGEVIVENCTFQGMGDDAVNVHAMYHIVENILEPTVLETHCRNDWIIEPEPGHVLELTDRKTLLPYATRKVVRVEVNLKEGRHRITLDAPVPPELQVGHVLVNVDWAPLVRVRNNIMRSHRARGVLIQSRDVVVENNTFDHVSGAGIHVTTDMYDFYESIGTRNVTIRNNTFLDCGFGATRAGAVVNVFARIGALGKGSSEGHPGVHRDILIENNTIENTPNCGIYLGATDGATVRDNTLRNVCAAPECREYAAGIRVQNSRNVRVENNRILGGKGMQEAVNVGDGCDRKTVTVKGNRKL